jgi:GH35 family endo-1,4-beta-xylanase
MMTRKKIKYQVAKGNFPFSSAYVDFASIKEIKALGHNLKWCMFLLPILLLGVFG